MQGKLLFLAAVAALVLGIPFPASATPTTPEDPQFVVYAKGLATTSTQNGDVVQDLEIWYRGIENYRVIATTRAPFLIVDDMLKESGRRSDVHRRGGSTDAVRRTDHTDSFAIVPADQRSPSTEIYDSKHGIATDFLLSYEDVSVRVTYDSPELVPTRSAAMSVELPAGVRWRTEPSQVAIFDPGELESIQAASGHSRLQWAAGGVCMRIYNYRNNVSGFFTAYSHIYTSGLTCHKVDVALWSGPVEGSGQCNSVGWLGSGPESTIYSSKSAYGFPAPGGNRMCSSHWGMNTSNVNITGFVGFNAAITG